MAAVTPFSNQISHNKNEKGAVLFIVAAGLVVFLVFAGLAVDLSMLYNVKTDLQNATDASALAGSMQLNGTTSGINRAVTDALAMAYKYHFKPTTVELVAVVCLF